MASTKANPVAIVGLACEIPSGDAFTNLDFDAFGDFLERGGCSIAPIASRFALDAQSKIGSASGQAVTDRASILADMDTFDHRAFGIATAEARRMTPQLRKLVEVTYRALQDSGIDTRTMGVFVGGSQVRQKPLHEPEHAADAHHQTGQCDCMLANRLSFLFDARGPSFNTDTACSASATALHLACESLRRGECESAVVASANHLATVEDHIGFSQLTVLSPDGQCRALSDEANGYVRGEAVVSLVVKPLELARRDGDRIYGTILGTALNSNGATAQGLTSPSELALRACVSSAWQSAGLTPEQATYVEMHATGTSVGDRIEGAALAAFGGKARKAPLLVGSVKSNVGHTEYCAFVVSLIKALHLLRRGKTFPQIAMQRPAKTIDWQGNKAQIASGQESLGVRPLIGLTASGFGGSNGHAVLSGYEDSAPEIVSNKDDLQLFVVSSLTEAATTQLGSLLESHVPKRGGQVAMAQTLARRARQNPWATYAIGKSISQATKKLGRPMPKSKGQAAPIALLFPGQGPQHLHMGRSLFQRYAIFRQSVLRSDAVYRKVVGRSLIEDEGLFGEEFKQGALYRDGKWSTLHILPSLTILQIALVDLLRSFGIQPRAMLAHSAGETAMAYASGAFNKNEDWTRAAEVAVRLSIIRAGLMAKTEGQGAGMMAVACSSRRAAHLLRKAGSELDIAAINGPDAVTLAGKRDALAAFAEQAKEELVQCTMLRTNVAAHSRFMQPLGDDLLSQLKSLFAEYGLEETEMHPRSDIDVFSSTVGGAAFRGTFDCDFWWQNTRNVVQFDDACRALNRFLPQAAVLELAPHPVLGALVEQQVSQTAGCFAALRRAKDPSDEAACGEADMTAFLSMLGEQLCRGERSINLVTLFGGKHPLDEQLPMYTFEKTLLPVQVAKEAAVVSRARLCADEPGLAVSADLFPDLAQHTVNNVTCMPAAGFMATALETIPGCRELRDMRIHVAMPIPAPGETPSRLTLSTTPNEDRFSLVSETVADVDSFVKTHHVEGRFATQESIPKEKLDIAAIYARCGVAVDEHDWLQILDSLVPQLGTNFRRVDGVHIGDDEAIATVRVPADRGYLVDPALIDAILHFSIAPCWYPMTAPPNEIYLPKRLARARFDSQSPLTKGDKAYAHVKIRSWSPDKGVVADCKLLDGEGRVVFALDRLLYERNAFSHASAPDVRLALQWQPLALLENRPLWEQGDRIMEPVKGHADVFRALDNNCLYYIHQAAAQLKNDEEGQAYIRHRQRYQTHLLAKSKLPVVTEKVKIPETHAGLGAVVDRIGPHVAAASVDELVGVQELFKDDIMTPAYELLGRMDRSFDDAVQSLFRAARAALASGKRTIRVVEAGAGTGQFSRVYAEAWLKRPAALQAVEAEFVVTDISPTLSKQALSEMPASLAAKAAVLDLSNPRAAMELGTFDVVLMWGVLHVVANVAEAIGNLTNLLVPGGYLIVIDLDNEQMLLQNPGAITMDTVMGVFKDWYAYDDGRSHCTMSADDWRATLQRNGAFEDVSFATTRSSYMSHIVITAQASAFYGSRQRAAVLEGDDARFDFTPGDEGSLAKWISQYDDETKTQPRLIVSAAKEESHAVWGLTRSGRVENPHLQIVVVMLAQGASITVEQALSLASPTEPELLVTADNRVHVRRLIALEAPRPFLLGSSASIDVVHVPGHDSVEQQATYHATQHQLQRGQTLVHVSQWVQLGAWLLLTGHVRGSKHVCALVSYIADSKPTTIAVPTRDIVEVASSIAVRETATALLQSLLQDQSANVAAVGCQLDLPQVKSIVKSDDPFGDVMDLDPEVVFFFQQTGNLRLHDCQQLCDRVIDFSRSTQSPLQGDKLEDVVKKLSSAASSSHPVSPPMSQAPDTPSSHIYRHGWLERTPLFDGDARYLLVGGCCSMGLRLAHFMYERGARHITCTSRSGGQAFVKRNSTSRRDRYYFSWLASQKDLTFETPAIDAVDDAAMAQLCAENEFQGALFLPIALRDKRLRDLEMDDFHYAYAPKVEGLKVLMRHLDPEAWLIATSSLSSLPGSQGSANYSAANTWMEQLVATRPRSVSMLVPSVTDAGTFARATAEEKSFSRARVWVDAASSMDEVSLAMADALMLLQDGVGGTVFVGRLSLGILLRFKGATKHLCTHLMNQHILNPHLHGRQDQGGVSMRSLVAQHLDMEPAEVRDDVALKVYGLDSLSASRLSAAIRRHFSIDVSQLELLSDATLGRLQTAAASRAAKSQVSAISSSSEQEDDDCVVHLNARQEGNPLFILHGGGIGIRHFRHWALGLPFPVYGVRETQHSATFCSAEEILSFYVDEIRKVQPQGPFRLAAFCLGALWAPRLVEILKEQGQAVESLIILDNSPALLLVPPFTDALPRSTLRSDVNNPFDTIFSDVITSVEQDAEPAFNPALLAELRQEQEGQVTPWVASFYQAMDRQLRFCLRMLYDRGLLDDDRTFSAEKLTAWLRSALTLPTGQPIPILAISMRQGLLNTSGYRTLDADQKKDMAMSMISNNVTSVCLPGSHYGAFGNSEADSSAAVLPLIDACVGHLSH